MRTGELPLAYCSLLHVICMIMARCYHCATPNATRPICRTCAMPSDSPATDPPAVEVDTTERVSAPADIALLPPPEGFESTVQVLGDVRLPSGAPPASITGAAEAAPVSTPGDESPPVPTMCPRCRVPAGASRLCDHCGMVVRPAGMARASDNARAADDRPSHFICPGCGVLNSSERSTCVACGQKV